MPVYYPRNRDSSPLFPYTFSIHRPISSAAVLADSESFPYVFPYNDAHSCPQLRSSAHFGRPGFGPQNRLYFLPTCAKNVRGQRSDESRFIDDVCVFRRANWVFRGRLWLGLIRGVFEHEKILSRRTRNHRNRIPRTMAHRRKTSFFAIRFPIQFGGEIRCHKTLYSYF